MQNMKIMTRLAIMMGIMSLAMLLTVGIGIYATFIARKGMDSIYYGGVEDVVELVKSNEDLKDHAIDRFKADWEKYLVVTKASGESDPEQEAMITKIQKTIGQVQNGENVSVLSNQLLELIQWHRKATTRDFEEAKKTLSSAQDYIIFIFILSFLLALFTAFWIAYNITRPLQSAVGFINRLTVGDLDFNIPPTSEDEVGQLLKATKELTSSSQTMSAHLTAVSQGDLTIGVNKRSNQDTLSVALAAMLDNLKHIVGELQGEVGILTVSSHEIVGSVSQVASSSAETASAVAETTTSVEELKQTAHLSDEKAKHVLTSAEMTMEIVTSSEKSLQSTLDEMMHISERMKNISTGIIKLSEHSQTIREIIETVNDLAEQSNLLAVNAAIEAAKAGEHGKSFAVVAQEIRSLAEQSKQATIQVRSILNDIQNATSEAVLATEQGSKAVEKGVRQSEETRDYMQKLTESMTEVANLATGIVDSSQQQLIGVDQVTVAMNNISDATVQHMNNMKQIETSVASLNSVGETLKDLISKYTLTKTRS